MLDAITFEEVYKSFGKQELEYLSRTQHKYNVLEEEIDLGSYYGSKVLSRYLEVLYLFPNMRVLYGRRDGVTIGGLEILHREENKNIYIVKNFYDLKKIRRVIKDNFDKRLAYYYLANILEGYHTHAMIITNTHTGKTLLSSMVGKAVEGATSANLVGFATANDLSLGSLAQISTLIGIDEFQENEKQLVHIFNYMRSGITTIAKGKMSLTCKGNATLSFHANCQELHALEFSDLLQTLFSEKFARTLGSRISYLVYADNLKHANVNFDTLKVASSIKSYVQLVDLGKANKKDCEYISDFLKRISENIRDSYLVWKFVNGMSENAESIWYLAKKMALVWNKSQDKMLDFILKTIGDSIGNIYEAVDDIIEEYRKQKFEALAEYKKYFIELIHKINKRKITFEELKQHYDAKKMHNLSFNKFINRIKKHKEDFELFNIYIKHAYVEYNFKERWGGLKVEHDIIE